MCLKWMYVEILLKSKTKQNFSIHSNVKNKNYFSSFPFTLSNTLWKCSHSKTSINVNTLKATLHSVNANISRDLRNNEMSIAIQKPHYLHTIGIQLFFNDYFRLWIFISLLVCCTFKISLAGFACLSNPCVFGVCIDDLNRLAMNVCDSNVDG